jgi:hypothetical protein
MMLPLISLPARAAKLEMFVIYGQSNALDPCSGTYGVAHGYKCQLPDGVPEYASALRFDVGVRIMGGVTAQWRTVLDPNSLGGLVPLNELQQGPPAGSGPVYGETMASGFAYSLQPMNVLMVDSALGGAELDLLQPILEPYGTVLPPYANTVATVHEAQALLPSGFTALHVNSVLFIHGESDELYFNTPPATYNAGVLALAASFCSDVKKITGQSDCPRWFISQATEPGVAVGSDGNAIAYGQALLGLQKRGQVTVFAPLYWGQYGGDRIHLLGDSEEKVGEYAAQAYRLVQANGYYQPLEVAHAWLRGGPKLLVSYYNPFTLPLVVDHTMTTVTAHVGFAYSDSCGTRVTGSEWVGWYVQVDLNQDPLAKGCAPGILSYGPNPNALQAVVHDSNATPSRLDGSPLWNYALAWSTPAQTPSAALWAPPITHSESVAQ